MNTLKLNKDSRYLALDILRGLTIALMILVNTPGSWETIYAPFKHADWHGFTITDLVFPTFLFVVGNALSFSMRKFENRPDNYFLKKVFTRSAKIFLIGLFLNAFPFFYHGEEGLRIIDFSEIRILGVLQRIAICFLLGSLIIHYLKMKTSIIVGVMILLGYWFVMSYLGNQLEPYSLEGNAALKFDILIFADANLYHGFGIPFDPEGLLSSLPAVVNVIAGYVVGVFIQKSGNTMTTVWKLVLSGLVLLVMAKFWDLYFPINKAIWTSSYVLYSIGWSMILISILILVVEIFKFKAWSYPFEAFGKNPLFIYVMSGVVISLLHLIWINGNDLQSIIYEHLFLNWLSPLNASLLFALVYTFLMWLIGYWMDRRKIYIKV